MPLSFWRYHWAIRALISGIISTLKLNESYKSSRNGSKRLGWTIIVLIITLLTRWKDVDLMDCVSDGKECKTHIDTDKIIEMSRKIYLCRHRYNMYRTRVTVHKTVLHTAVPISVIVILIIAIPPEQRFSATMVVSWSMLERLIW